MSLLLIATGLIGVAVVVLVALMMGASGQQVSKEKVVPVKSLADFEVPVRQVPEPVVAVAPAAEVLSLETPPITVYPNKGDEHVVLLKEIEEANDALRADNKLLKNEVAALTERYRDLLASFDAYKLDTEAQIAGLIKSKDIVTENTRQEVANQVLQLTQEVGDLQRTQEKLKELNNTLSLKSDMLQYELIKARAQATGFERISQNYRQQLEQITGQLQNINQDNQQLSQHKNRLESMLSDMKNAYEELTHRERLAQLELTKRVGA